jgi:hypothetical protein
VALCACPFWAHAKTLEVGSGKAYAKLSAALAAAQPGHIIEISAGTYTNDPVSQQVQRTPAPRSMRRFAMVR